MLRGHVSTGQDIDWVLRMCEKGRMALGLS